MVVSSNPIPSEIALARLRNQWIAYSKAVAVKDVVARMGAMQAQDYAMAKWAIGLRLPGSTVRDIERAIDSGEIIRTHLLRPTWHFVAADDLRWILESDGPPNRRRISDKASPTRPLGSAAQ